MRVFVAVDNQSDKQHLENCRPYLDNKFKDAFRSTGMQGATIELFIVTDEEMNNQ